MAETATSMTADAPRTGTAPAVIAVVLALLAVLIGLKAAQLSGAHGRPIDFECFHVVGGLVRAGSGLDAYRAQTLHEALQRAGWTEGFMPWTYPPQFALIVGALAGLPLGAAYTLFIGLTSAAFLWVLRSVAGARFGEALLLAAPVIAVNIAGGQNGLLTGALAGSAALALAQRRSGAGWALGALVIKPHLAVGLAASTLAGRRWGVAVLAGGVVLASSAAVTCAFGPKAWLALADSVREAGAFLREGFYPLHRMASIYAVLRSLGLSDAAALAGQAVVALGALAAIARLSAGGSSRTAAGFALLASGLVSPYLYD